MMITKKIFYRIGTFSLVFFLLLTFNSYVYADYPQGFYIGPSMGYASTDWGFLVTPNFLPNGDWNMAAASAPVAAKDSGADFSVLAGYRFSKYFAIEGSYSYFHNTHVTLDSANYILDKHHVTTTGGTYTFNSKTQAIALQLKLSLPITFWGLKNLSVFSSLGPEVTFRKDMFADTSRIGGVFGAGLDYDFNSRISSQLYFNYYTGYGESNVYPVEGYMPFIYQINTAILITL